MMQPAIDDILRLKPLGLPQDMFFVFLKSDVHLPRKKTVRVHRATV